MSFRKPRGMTPPKQTATSAPHIRRPSIRTGRAAFGSGGTQAFRDPQTMVAPDQAFGAAMAMPQTPGSNGQ